MRLARASCFEILGGMNAVARPIRLLHLEDSEPDHALALAYLRRGGLDVDARRVETRADFEAALDEAWDVVLSDYNLPGFSGVEALQLLQARLAVSGGLVPFMLVSGQIGEDARPSSRHAQRRQPITCSRTTWRGWRRRCCTCHRQASDAHRARLRRRPRAAAQPQAALQRTGPAPADHDRDAERAAIAREIHDDVGGSLDGHQVRSGLDCPQLRQVLPVRERAVQALESVKHAIEASQRIMHNLRPAILEQGLVAALQWMTSRFERAPASPRAFRTSQRPSPPACRRAAGGLPHGAGSADQRLQARAGHAGRDRPDRGGRRACRWRSVRQRPRPGAGDLGKARGPSAFVDCMNELTPWAAGSTCPARRWAPH
jgi:CheY-like chemotaxis protein